MDWRDEGILLTARRHGESAAIVEVFTARHGRHAGVVRGGGSRRMAPVLQPGSRLAVEWSARLEEHIGTFRVDPIGARAAAIMADPAALAALAAMTALVAATLPERDAHPDLYARSLALLDALAAAPDWPARYAAWELALLAELGFGLDLAACAVTGATQDLVWVSPRTGRAVSPRRRRSLGRPPARPPGLPPRRGRRRPRSLPRSPPPSPSPATSSTPASRPACRAAPCRPPAPAPSPLILRRYRRRQPSEE